MSRNIGITKQEYQNMCKESDNNFGYPTEQEQEHATKDIMQEQITNLEKQQIQLLTMIRDLTSIRRPWHKGSDRTEREEVDLGRKWVRFWRVTDSLGELNIELKAFNSLPQ